MTLHPGVTRTKVAVQVRQRLYREGVALVLRHRHPNLDVIGIAAGSEDMLPALAYQAGVRSVFPRNAGITTLLSTLRSPPSPSRTASPEVAHLAERRPVLSRREVEVLCEIGSGSTTRSVATSMGISPKTVENHKQRIFSKLGVQNQAHAVALAMRQGLLVPVHRGPPLLPVA